MPPEEQSALAFEDTGTGDRFDSILDTSDEQVESEVEDTAEYPDDGQVSDEDSFTSVDPKTLPPELQAQYKNLQRDYTRKQQAAAEKVRQYESQLAEHQKQVQQYQAWAQQVQPILQQHQQAQQKPAAAEQAPDYSAMTPEQILQYEVDTRLKAALEPYNQALQQAHQRVAQIERARAEEQLKQAYTAQVSEAFSEHGEDNVKQRSDELTKLIQQIPQLTVSQAYAILTYKQAKNDGAKTVQDSLEAKRRAASISKPTSRAEPEGKPIDTGDPFESAFLEAKAELSKR